jgi:glucosyl-dolichyl phosphate glucuronosyltransferase
MVKLSVVICTYNRCQMLKACLDSLVNQTVPHTNFEIIVIDNNSNDDTQKVIQGYYCKFDNIRVISEQKQGLSNARNRGWREANGAYIAYIDDDARADKNWVGRIILSFQEIKPSPDVVGGKIIPFFYGQIPPWFPIDIEVLSRGDQKRFLTDAEGQYGFYGSNMIFKKEILQESNGFSTEYGMQGNAIGVAEETEFFRRLSKLSRLLWYDPDIIVEHLISKNSFDSKFIFRRCYKNGKALAEIENSRILSLDYAKKVLGLFLFFLVRLDKKVRVPSLRGYIYIRLKLIAELLGYILNTRRFR